MTKNSLINMTEDLLKKEIELAGSRVALVAPGVTSKIAEALIGATERGVEVNVVLDADPEVFRLGYGEFKAMEDLANALPLTGSSLMKHEGIRICLLATERVTVCFAPTPLLIEAGSTADSKPNAVVIAQDAAEEIEANIADLVQGNNVTAEDLRNVDGALQFAPPKSFNVSRTERVYQSFLRYVEFEMTDYLLQGKRVRIPPDLLPLGDGYLKSHVESILRPYSDSKILEVEMTSTANAPGFPPISPFVVSPKVFDEVRRGLRKHYFIELPGFGSFVRVGQSKGFENDVESIRVILADYATLVQERLLQRRQDIENELFEALWPSVSKSPPKRWTKYLLTDDEAEAKRMLTMEINRILIPLPTRFHPKLTIRYKDVTYETIKDPKFGQALNKYFGEKTIKKFFPEHIAAPETPSQPGMSDPEHSL